MKKAHFSLSLAFGKAIKKLRSLAQAVWHWKALLTPGWANSSVSGQEIKLTGVKAFQNCEQISYYFFLPLTIVSIYETLALFFFTIYSVFHVIIFKQAENQV